MNEDLKKNLEKIGVKLESIPEAAAAAAINQFSYKIEGFVEGFAACQAHAESRKEQKDHQ